MIEFPAEISYKGREGCLTRKKSWLSTYMFDILGLDYTKTAEEGNHKIIGVVRRE